MKDKIKFWTKEKEETLAKLENTNDSFLIMQHKIQLNIIENVLTELLLKQKKLEEDLNFLYKRENLDLIASNS